MPKVSILLTSYNHADYIGESIDSILNQTFKDFELYIIDDCSTDNSWEVIKKYKDKRIISVRHKSNMGGSIFPEVIEKLKGEYFAIAHCDDKWELDKLEKQVKFLDKNKEYAACFTDVSLIDDDGNEFTNTNHPYYNKFNQKNRTRLEWLKQFFYKGNVLCHPSILIRLNKQKEYNLYATALRSLPDMYRWVKLCLNDNIYVWNEKLTNFRVRSDESNTSGDRIDNLIGCEFDNFCVLDLYLYTVKYKEKDFCKIYPEAKKYMVKGKNDLEYIFARILIDFNDKAYQLYGMKLMWKILQDPKRKKDIIKRYNYEPRDLIKKTSTLDIFGIKNSLNIINSTLYYDCGNNFNENDSISKEIYINRNNEFFVDFKLENLDDITIMRFDPNENSYMQYKDIKFSIDGKNIGYWTDNYCEEEGWIKFNTSDPRFILNVNMKAKEKKILQVSGKAKLRDYEDIDKLLEAKKDSRIQKKIKSIHNLIKRRK